MKNLIKPLIIGLSTIVLVSGCTIKKPRFYVEIAKAENVNYKTIRAICEHESGNYDYVINVNKSRWGWKQGAHYFKNKMAANIFMDVYLKPFNMNYDVGVCQINTIHLKRFNLDNEDLLDKATNIRIASKIYKENVITCKGEIMCALSMYNTGRKKSTIGTAYANKVLKIRSRLYDE